MTLPTSFFTGLNIDNNTADAVAGSVALDLRRTGALAHTFPRAGATMAAQTIATTQGTYTAIELAAGTVVSNIVFSAIGASSSMTNNFAALYGSTFTAPLAVSADKTTTAVSANTEVTYAMTTPYTVPADGRYYVLLSTTGSGLPTWAGVTANAIINLKAPAAAFLDSTTTYGAPATAPSPAVQTAGSASILYAWVS